MKRLLALSLCLCLGLLLGLRAVPAMAEPSVPVGTVISYYGTVAPDGYFVCDGASFDDAAFPKLREVLGSNILPDLRGYFVRGYDTRNDVDPNGAGRELASAQGDAIRNIQGTVGVCWDSSAGLSVATGPFKSPGWAGDSRIPFSATGSYLAYRPNFDASRVVPTAAENRPKNKTLLYCIKHDEPEAPAPSVPDLRIGVETKWPLLYQGKQVYAKLINFGQLPAGAGLRMVTHGIVDIEWAQVSWDYSNIRDNNDTSLKTFGLTSTPAAFGNMRWRFLVDKNTVQANSLTTDNNSAWSAVVCILYTKTTDQPVNP